MPAPVRQYQYAKDKPSLLTRMRKIEGQAKGIQRMIENGRYCMDIIQQLKALSGSIDEVAMLILQEHVEGCVINAIPLYLKQIRT